MNRNLNVDEEMILNEKQEFVNLETSNNYKIQSSYDLGELNKNENIALLKVKFNSNTKNEFAIVNSNFEVNYMAISEDGVDNICSFKEHTQRINDIAFFKQANSPLDKAFLTGSADGTIKLWDSRTSNSVKTIKTKSPVNCLDTSSEHLAAGFGSSIGLFDLKMLKNTNRAKWAHSDNVTSLKLKGKSLVSGGEDDIINILDITNGLGMQSVESQMNINQSIASVNFLDEEMNFVRAITLVQTFQIVNMYTGAKQIDFECINVNFIFLTHYRKYITLNIY